MLHVIGACDNFEDVKEYLKDLCEDVRDLRRELLDRIEKLENKVYALHYTVNEP